MAKTLTAANLHQRAVLWQPADVNVLPATVKSYFRYLKERFTRAR